MATSNAATNYLERRILDFIFKGNSLSFASPGDNIYVGLATAVTAAETGGVTEADFPGYGRKQVTAANWTTVGDDTTDTQTAKNTNNIEFDPHTGGGADADVISHVFIADDSTGGNILFVGVLDNPKTIAEGDIFRINAENLVIELK